MQREVLEVHPQSQLEGSALFSKGLDETCTGCGNKGHSNGKWWRIIGYPKWHPKPKKFSQKQGRKDGKITGTRPMRVKQQHRHKLLPREMVLVVWPCLSIKLSNCWSRCLLPPTQPSLLDHRSYDTDEELEGNFAGLCNKEAKRDW